jgi:NAD(P)H-dependent flavin oxidoreductase YrpB (nitropropane dioxygenase family)
VLTTAFTRLVSIEAPIVSAPIAGSPDLVAAVSNAGGLGILQGTWLTPDGLGEAVRATHAMTDRPIGINLVVDGPRDEQLEAALAAGVDVVSFCWGDPEPYIARVHGAGAMALLTVGSADEARHAAAIGVDAVVAQGWEAGGHVWGQVATLPLVPAVKSAVGDLPVLAAGGIADGRGLAAVLALGADAAWVGTRFLASEEAPIASIYQRRVIDATEDATLYTTVFDVGWPAAPHRVLRNSTTADWEANGRPTPGSRPGQGDVVATTPDGTDVPRYSFYPPLAGLTGDMEAMALYAGQSAGIVHTVEPAGAIVRQMVREAETVLHRLSHHLCAD